MTKHVMHKQRMENAAAQRERIKQASSLQDLIRKPCKIPENPYQQTANTFWTNNRTEQLKKMAGVVTVKGIAEKLGTKEVNIRVKACRLGLSLAISTIWTDEMKEQLRALAPVLEVKHIASVMRLRESDVRNAAARLDISVGNIGKGRAA